MTTAQPPDKLDLRALTEIPRMVGDSDIRLVRALAGQLPDNARIVEFGPWLGGVSIVLAEYGELHVVDRFIWSDANAERYPGLATPGENFRPIYEALLADYGAAATVHEAAFGAFEWPGDDVDFCFIDGPRQPEGLMECLKAIAPALRDGARVLVKNGLNPAHIDMMALLHVLAALNVVRIVQTDQPAWCNIAVLEPGPELASLADIHIEDDLFVRCPLAPDVRDSRGKSGLVLARLAQRLSRGDVAGAFGMLDRLPPAIDNLYAWDALEAKLKTAPELQTVAAGFSEVFAGHNDPPNAADAFMMPRNSVSWVLRAAWHNNAHQPQRVGVMQLEALCDVVGTPQLALADRLGARLHGRRVVEIGTGLGLSGIVCVVCGVTSYYGVEMGELTAAMLQAEDRFDAVSYMPIATADPAAIGAVDVIVVHADPQDPQFEPLVTRLKSASPNATIETLPANTPAGPPTSE